MMVALIPTGRTEWYGLATALQRLFPDHEFYARPDEITFKSMGPYDGFTTTALSARHESAYLPENASELVGLAAAEALGDGPRAEPADVVIVIDDLELANQHQPDRVARVFRQAVVQHLDGLQGARRRTAEVLRARVSFHLVVPMIEAWFFGDPKTLREAGVPEGRAPCLDGASLEDFLTFTDMSYVAATEAACPCWVAQGRKKADRPKWLGDHRERHPKGYLQWLCHQGGAKSCTSYAEVPHGARALGQLDWTTLLAKPELHYLGALVEDLSDALGEPTPAMRLPGGSTAHTSLSRRPRDHVLRNL